MKISAVIEELKRIQDAYGDLHVVSWRDRRYVTPDEFYVDDDDPECVEMSFEDFKVECDCYEPDYDEPYVSEQDYADMEDKQINGRIPEMAK